MQTLNSNSSKSNQRGIKTLITIVSLGLAVGLWNLFSNLSFNQMVAKLVRLINPEGQLPPGTALDLPPIPVLDPVPTLVRVETDPVMIENPVLQDPTQITLKDVLAPTPQPIIQKSAPVVEALNSGQAVVDEGGSKSSRSGKPSGSTKSSK